MNPFLFFGCASVLSGSALLAAGGRALVRAVRSKSWPSVEGSIASSAIIKDQYSNSHAKHWLRAAIRYSYCVRGRSYAGQRIRFLDQGTNDAETVVARYPAGKAVRIYYSPADASLSVLEPGATWFQTLFLPIALALITAGITLLLRSRH